MMKFQTDELWILADKLSRNAEEEKDTQARDLTEEFFEALKSSIKVGERICLTINGKTRTWKSTSAFYIGKFIFEYMQKIGQIDKNKKFGLDNIAIDQFEKSMMLRDKKRNFTVIVRDEENVMEKTGENSTSEEAVGTGQSTMMADMRVHSIDVQPKGVSDPNCNMILITTGQNYEHGVCHCYLYYRLYKGGIDYDIFLGYVNIPSYPIVKNWIENVKDKFYENMRNPTEELNNFLCKEREKDWYVDYYIRKHLVFDLLNKHGIARRKYIYYAQPWLDTINNLVPLALIGHKIERNLVFVTLEAKMRAHKMVTSMMGDERNISRITAVLGVYKDIAKLKKMEEDEKDEVKKILINKSQEQLTEYLNSYYREMNTMIAIKKEFNKEFDKADIYQ